MGATRIDRSSVDKSLIESSISSKKALKLLGVKDSGNSSLPTSPKSKEASSSFLNVPPPEHKVWDQKAILKHITDEYPYLVLEFEKLTQEQLRDIFFAYKWMSMSLALHVSSNNNGAEPSALAIGPQVAVFRKTFVVKVKEPGDKHFKMILTEIISIEKLKNDIGERFGGGHMNPKRVSKLILLPDVILERDEDVKFIHHESELQVYFEEKVVQ
jgi:hypothetical protein